MKNLLLVNYAMDENSSVFSHQAESANEISNYFSKVIVLTSQIGEYPYKENVVVKYLPWQSGRNIRNVIFFYQTFLDILRKEKIDVVFCHMTDVQSALLGIPLKVLKIPQYLWYAHATKSRFLAFSSYFVSGLITSTRGSLPVFNSKVHIIGQAINSKKFEFVTRDSYKFFKFVHFGRLDKSKRISEIVETIREQRELDGNSSLTLYGSPSTPESVHYVNQIVQELQGGSDGGWLILHPAVSRNRIGSLLLNFDIFIHAYIGSLDKSILEATFVGIPVVTANPEYLEIFGSWNSAGFFSLENEIEALKKMSHSEITSVLNSRRELALSKHSLTSWSHQIAQILNR